MSFTIEPDLPPRNSPYHRRIISFEPIPGTRSGNILTLECGHRVQGWGDLNRVEGRVMCAQCKNAAEPKAADLPCFKTSDRICKAMTEMMNNELIAGASPIEVLAGQLCSMLNLLDTRPDANRSPTLELLEGTARLCFAEIAEAIKVSYDKKH